jgi:uncharacterized membrane protein YccC
MSEELAIVIIACTGFVCAAAVLVLRPLSRRLGGYLEAKTHATLRPSAEPEIARLREVLTRIDGRMNQLEERQDFAEALISASDPKLLHVPAATRTQERN